MAEEQNLPNYLEEASNWSVPDLQDMADQIADHYGIDKGMFRALIGHESSWKVDAANKTSSALGLGQFLDSTNRDYDLGLQTYDRGPGGKINPADERLHPGKMMDAAARLLLAKKGNTWAERIKNYGEGTDEYLSRVVRQWQKDQARPTAGLPGAIAKGLHEGTAKTAAAIASIPARGAGWVMEQAGKLGLPEPSPEELLNVKESIKSMEGGIERAINPTPYGPTSPLNIPIYGKSQFAGDLAAGLASGAPEIAGLILSGAMVPHIAAPAALARASSLAARLFPAMTHGAGTFGLWDILKGEGPERAAIGAGMGAALPIVGPTFGRLARAGYGGAIGGVTGLVQSLLEGRTPTAEELGHSIATMGIYHALGRKRLSPEEALKKQQEAFWKDVKIDLSQFETVPQGTPGKPPQLPPPQLALPAPDTLYGEDFTARPAGPTPPPFRNVLPGPVAGQKYLPPPPTGTYGPETGGGPGFVIPTQRPETIRRPLWESMVNTPVPPSYPPVLETIPGISPGKALGLRPQDIVERLMLQAAGLPESAGLRAGPGLGAQLPVRMGKQTEIVKEMSPQAPTLPQEAPAPPARVMGGAVPERGVEGAGAAVFNETTTGTPHWDNILKKGEASIERMSPDEYLNRVAKLQGISLEQSLRAVPDNLPRQYAERMRKGEKAPLPILDEVEKAQEGRARALAAKELGIEEIPVLVRKATPVVKELTLEARNARNALAKSRGLNPESLTYIGESELGHYFNVKLPDGGETTLSWKGGEKPSGVAKKEGKEPWEMTKEEFRDSLADKKMANIHNNAIRLRGIDIASEAQVKSYFKELRKLADSADDLSKQDAHKLIDEAENNYYAGNLKQAIVKSEEAMSLVHDYYKENESQVALADLLHFDILDKAINEGKKVPPEIAEGWGLSASKSKEPWEMTREKLKKGKEVWEMTFPEFRKMMSRPEMGDQNPELFKDGHRWQVEVALKEGKPVPPEVLADYPDLAAKYEKGEEKPPISKEAIPTKEEYGRAELANAIEQTEKELAKAKRGELTVGKFSQYKSKADAIRKISKLLETLKNDSPMRHTGNYEKDIRTGEWRELYPDLAAKYGKAPDVAKSATGEAEYSPADLQAQAKSVKEKGVKATEELKPLNLKDQKKFAIDKLDDALAGPFKDKGGPKTITIDIPGDGEFTIHNEKEVLEQVKKNFAKLPTTEPKPVNYEAQPYKVPKPLGTRNALDNIEEFEYYSPKYTPKKSPLEIKEGKTTWQDGYYSTGNLLIYMPEKPKGIGEEHLKWQSREKSLKDYLTDQFAQQATMQADIEGEFKPVNSKISVVVIKSGDTRKAISAKFVDSIIAEHPRAKPYLSENQEHPVVFRVNDAPVAAVSGYRLDEKGWERYNELRTEAAHRTLPGVEYKGKLFSVRSPAPVFYSKLEKTVRESLPNRGTGAQIAEVLESWAKKGQFKADELKWSGVIPWLKEQTGPVTKEQVLEKLREGRVEVREVERQDKSRLPDWEYYFDEWLADNYTPEQAEGRRNELYDKWRKETGQPKFQSFMKLPPGGENYREVLLTWPKEKELPRVDVKDPDAWKKSNVVRWLPPGRTETRTQEWSRDIDGKEYRITYYPHTDKYVLNGGKGKIQNAHADSLEIAMYWAEQGKTTHVGYFTDTSLFRVPSSHAYGDTAADVNRFAHVIADDRVIGGKKYLTVWEMQSDWAAEGRRKGYQGQVPKIGEKFLGRQQELERIADIEGQPVGIIRVKDSLRNEFNFPISELKEGVPPFPFSKNWHEVALKRVIRYAAEQGYDGVAIASGDMVKERYDLSKKVSKLRYSSDNQLVAYGLDGTMLLSEKVSPEKVSDYVGKEAADKLLKQQLKRAKEFEESVNPDNLYIEHTQGDYVVLDRTDIDGPPVDIFPNSAAAQRFIDSFKYRGELPEIEIRELTGPDLKIGGEWANRFYDETIPSFLKKYVKQWGAGVEKGEIDTAPPYAEGKIWGVFDQAGNLQRSYSQRDLAQNLADEYRGFTVRKLTGMVSSIPTFPITPAMRDSVIYQGQALFKERSPYERIKEGKAAPGVLASTPQRRPGTPEAGAENRRDLADFQRRATERDAGTETADIYRGIEISESLEKSSEFAEIAAKAQGLGVDRVLPIKGSSFAAVIDYDPKLGQVVLIDENSGPHTPKENFYHEVFHRQVAMGNPDAVSLVKMVNQGSDTFREYRDALAKLYRDAGLPPIKNETVAEELAADYAAGISRGNLEGRPIDLKGAFDQPLRAFSVKSKYMQGIEAGGLAEIKAAKISEKAPPEIKTAIGSLKGLPELPKYSLRKIVTPDDVLNLKREVNSFVENAKDYTSWLRGKLTANAGVWERLKSLAPDVASEDMTFVGKLIRLPSWKAKEDPDVKRIWNISRNLRLEVPSILRVKALEDLRPALELGVKDLERLKYWWVDQADKINQSGMSLEKQQVAFDKLTERMKATEKPQVYEAFMAVQRFFADSKKMTLERLAAQGIPKSEIEKLRRQIGGLIGYFPHFWDEGKYYVVAQDKEGNTIERATAGGLTLRRTMDQMQAKYPKLEIKTGKNQGLPEEIFFGLNPVHAEIMARTAVEKAGLPKDVSDRVIKEMADTFKARGFGSRFIERENVLGYITDAHRIPELLTKYVMGWSGFLGKLEAAPRYMEALADIDPKAKPNVYGWAEHYIKDSLQNSGRIDQSLGKLRNLMYIKHITGVPSTAMLNLTQNATAFAPYMSAVKNPETGKMTQNAYLKTNRAMMDLVKDGRAYWQFINGKKNPEWRRLTTEEGQALNDAFATGHLYDSLTKDLIGSKFGPAGKMLNMVSDAMGFMFGNAEKFNRASSFLMAFREFRKEHKLPYEQAVDKATTAVDDTQFVYGKYNLPEIARHGPVGKGIRSTGYVFKQFLHNYYELMRHLSRQEGGIKAIGKAAGTMALLGGATAIPMMRELAAIYKSITGEDPVDAAWSGTNKGENNIYTLFRFGIPGFLGIDFSGPIAVTLPGVEYQSPAGLGVDVLGGPPGRMLFSEVPQAIDYYRRGAPGRAVEEVAPRFLKGPMKAYRESTEGVTTKRGQTVVDEFGMPVALTGTEGLIRSLGFQPPSATIRRESQEQVYEAIQRRQDRQDILASRYMNAMQNQDGAEMQRVMSEIAQYNLEASMRGEPGIDLQSLLKRRMKPKTVPKSWQNYQIMSR